MGKTFIVKDFLVENSKDLNITRGINNKRRKCDVIYMDTIAEEFKKLLT